MGWLDRGTIFALVAVSASARAFEWPTMAALLPSLVQRGMLPVATAWATTANQLAQIGGPALGGFLYAPTPAGAFATPSVLFICAALLTSRVAGAAPVRPGRRHADVAVFRFRVRLFAAPAAGGAVARSVRGAVRRRGGAAADLRARHPDDRTVGPRPVARGAGAGRAGHVGGAGALSADPQRRAAAVRRRDDFWRRHRRVRPFDVRCPCRLPPCSCWARPTSSAW